MRIVFLIYQFAYMMFLFNLNLFINTVNYFRKKSLSFWEGSPGLSIWLTSKVYICHFPNHTGTLPILWLCCTFRFLLLFISLRLTVFQASQVGGPDGKESACNAGDSGSVPGLGRSPGVGNGNPLQYSCLENPMDRGAWRAIVHGIAKSDMTEQLSSHTHPKLYSTFAIVIGSGLWALWAHFPGYGNNSKVLVCDSVQDITRKGKICWGLLGKNSLPVRSEPLEERTSLTLDVLVKDLA